MGLAGPLHLTWWEWGEGWDARTEIEGLNLPSLGSLVWNMELSHL